MIRTLSAIAFVVAATSLHAQTIAVRAGEHIGFTRLVFDLPDGIDWRFEETDRGYALDYGEDAVFELDRVFDRIPKERLIDAVDAGDGQVELVLACRCPAVAEPFQGRSLIVDIRDGERGRPPVPATTDRQEPASEVTVELPILSDDRLTPLPERILDAEQDMPREELTISPSSPRVEDARQALIDSLSRAAEDGLLDIADPDDFPALETSETVPVVDTPKEPDDPLSDLEADHLLLRSRTAIEKARPDRVPNAAAEAGCFDADLFDIGAWTSDDDFAKRVSEGRAALFGEFDRPNGDAALDLARAYLSFGLGREARALSRRYGDVAPAWRAVEAIGTILDGETMITRDAEGLAGCDGPLAIWAVLAGATGPGRPGFDVETVQLSLVDLPDALRPRIGALLAQRIFDAGDPELADIILRFSQTPLEEETETRILKAQIDGAAGLEAAGRTALAKISETSARMTPDALISLISLDITSGAEVSEDVVLLGEALHREYSREPVGEALAEALVDARISRREYGVAVETAEEFITEPNRQRDLASRVVISAVADASEGTFVHLMSETPSELLTFRAREAAVERLEAIRLPDLARRVGGPELAARSASASPVVRPQQILESPIIQPTAEAEPEDVPGALAARRAMIDRSEGLRQRVDALIVNAATGEDLQAR